MFGALAFRESPVARLRLCSWRDNGWRALLVRSFANAEVADELVLPATDEQALVLITEGTTAIESRHGSRWHRADYGPGRIGMTAPGTPTHIRWRGTEPTLTTHVFVPSRLIDRTAIELYGRGATQVNRPDALAVDDPVLAAVVRGLGEAALAGADELYAETAAAFLAAHLLTRHAEAPVPRPMRGEDIRVRRAISFIRDNYASPLTLTEIAAVAELSPFHFLRVFKQATGQTPYRFLSAVRLDRARRYLERDDLSVTEIAHLCGFGTPSRLATAFRQETGHSPTSYRNSRQ
ncbi:MAG TPA: AraC family transcriptional regulator [Amycolatopsis sp.]|nr:AraC family transcriptional regulator [Amycolatopsis sp.]